MSDRLTGGERRQRRQTIGRADSEELPPQKDAELLELLLCDVDDDAVALFDNGVVGGMMGIGGVGAEGDDGVEGKSLAAIGCKAAIQIGGAFPLGDTVVDIVRQLFHALVVDLRGPAHQAFFRFILPGADTVHAG